MPFILSDANKNRGVIYHQVLSNSIFCEDAKKDDSNGTGIIGWAKPLSFMYVYFSVLFFTILLGIIRVKPLIYRQYI